MNNTDMYCTYSDGNFPYFFPISFNKRNKDYLELNSTPNIQWNEGDTISIIFKITDHDTSDIELKGSRFIVSFYNFRGEKICCRSFDYDSIDPFESYLILWVDKEMTQLFPPGVYNVDIVMTNEENDSILTLMTKDEFLIRVN